MAALVEHSDASNLGRHEEHAFVSLQWGGETISFHGVAPAVIEVPLFRHHCRTLRDVQGMTHCHYESSNAERGDCPGVSATGSTLPLS